MTTQLLGTPDSSPVDAALVWIEETRQRLFALGEQELTESVQLALRLAAGAEGLAVALTQEAESRGVIAASTSVGVAGWVKDQAAAAGAPMSGARAARFQRITHACKAPGMQRLAEAVTTGALGVEAAAVAAGELSRIRAHVPAETWDACVGEIVDYALTGASARQLAELRDVVITQYSEDEDYLLRRERAAHRQREFTRFRAGADGSYTARLRLDGPSTALVEAIIEALAAPNPDRPTHPLDGDPHDPDDPDAGDAQGGSRPSGSTAGSAAGGRDRRSAGQRRADALLDMCRAYVTHPDIATGQRPGAVAKAQVVITMNLDDLRRKTATHHANAHSNAHSNAHGLNGQPARRDGGNGHNHAPAGLGAPGSGSTTGHTEHGSNGRSPLWRTLTKSGRLLRAQGCGLTSFGLPLSAEAVRAFACEARIIPMVLGSRSEILDQGRAVRTATPGQLAHLRERDKGCTYPGCDRPPGFCQAHHIQHWIDDGPTDIANLTLLCTRHHHVVHRDHYSATVTPTGVVWHPPSASVLGASILTKPPPGGAG